MSVFVISLLLVNVVNVFGPLMGDSKSAFAISALTSYFLFAAVAYWLDTRRPRSSEFNRKQMPAFGLLHEPQQVPVQAASACSAWLSGAMIVPPPSTRASLSSPS